MGRPSEVNTKTVSVRVPMDKYIELLSKAVSLKLSLSEYLNLLIFGDINDIDKESNEKKDISNEKTVKKWVLKDTFSNKENYISCKNDRRNTNFSNTEILTKLKKGGEVISKNGKWKIKSIRKGLNHVYKLE
jgi:hypothetical protein